MLKDLQTKNNMDSIVALFFAMVEENYLRLRSIVKNITNEELNYKGPVNQSNSIAQLIKHLAYVDLKWVYRIKNEPIPVSLEKK